MAKKMKVSKRRRVSTKPAKRKLPVPPKAARKPKAAIVKPKRRPAAVKPAPPRPARRPAPSRVKPNPTAPAKKGPSETMLERRIKGLQEQLLAREADRVELERWKAYHSQLQNQVKAKDSALAFKEKELLDMRRRLDELKAQAEKKGKSA